MSKTHIVTAKIPTYSMLIELRAESRLVETTYGN